MNKAILALLFSISLSPLFAQFHLSFSGGYCLPLASSFSSVNETEFQNTGFPQYYTVSQQITRTSYGQGGNIALALDWFSKNNFGCGLKLNALISSHYSYSANVNYLDGTSANFNFTDKPFSFQFAPHISIKHDFKTVSPILEIGLLAGITNVRQDYQAAYSTGNEVVSSINNHGSVMIGFYSSFGLAFKVAKVVRITLALNCSAGSYSPSQWDRTSFTVNGVDQMNNLPVSEKQGTYVKQLDLNTTQPTNQPHQDLKFSFPFSNVGINAGIAFVLIKNTKPAKEIKDENAKERIRKKWEDTY